MTPGGYLVGSQEVARILGVSQGLRSFSIAQLYDHLYRPDLVEELLKGDPEGKYQDAVSILNLEKILDSGPAPQIELREKSTELVGGTVRLSVRLKDI
jgi:hypothetical protein